jgi:hypothetical protein
VAALLQQTGGLGAKEKEALVSLGKPRRGLFFGRTQAFALLLVIERFQFPGGIPRQVVACHPPEGLVV